jgi:ketosteroid isomerase-like protein
MVLMGDRERLIEISGQLADAIGRRDVSAVRGLLADGFVQRHAGGDAVETGAFLDGIAKIPGEILSIAVQQLTVDVTGDGAIVTGVQHARLRIDGELVDDHRSFVDWFVRQAGDWRLRAAVDLE